MAERRKDEERKNRYALLMERKKIIFNLVLFFAASVVVLIGVLTMAWFAANEKANGTNMSISVEVQGGMQVSLGHIDNGTLQVQSGAVVAPSVLADWSDDLVEVSKYYRFGRLFPASSDTGEHILFTPDSTDMGRKLQEMPRFFIADEKRTDGMIKHALNSETAAGSDSDELMAKAHVLTSAERQALASGSDEPTSFWDGYVPNTAWFDTNDDGYYVDIPLWVRSNSTNDIDLCVEGWVTKWDGSIDADEDGVNSSSDPDRLYKSVRVAVLKEVTTNDVTALKPAFSAGADKIGTIIPLKNVKTSSGINAGTSILDSKLLTDRDNNKTAGKLYGLHPANAEVLSATAAKLENAAEYVEYAAYAKTKTIDTIPGKSGEDAYGATQKLILRIWIDGDDKDCYNATAGQDWCINLIFSEKEN